MNAPSAPSVPLRLRRWRAPDAVEPKGRTQEAQTITSQQIYPQLLANSNCRQWKGIIVVDQ